MAALSITKSRRAVSGRDLATVKEVNDIVCEVLRDGRSDPIAFFCECDDDACYQAVWLSADEYTHRRATPGWRAISEAHAAA